jgi:hypothetical protein
VTTWQVFRNGRSVVLVQRETEEEAIVQAQKAMGTAKGEWKALPWNAAEHLNRDRLP